mgnify:FL=1
MIKLPLSLFSRLYLGVAFVILCSVAVTRIAGEMVFKKEEFTHFSTTSQHIKELALQQTKDNPQLRLNGYKLPPPFAFYFNAKFIQQSQWPSFCQQCSFKAQTNNVEYFELEEGEHVARYLIDSGEYYLAVYEKTDEEHEGEMEELHLEELDHFLFLFLCLILMSISLYWPLKKVRQQIRGLNKAQKLFGAGDMSARANEDILRPLDEIATNFNHMADAIDKSVKERAVFSHAIPHEIRTPLSRIQLAAGVMRQQTSDENIGVLLDDVDKYIFDINELITQIVSYSKLTNSDSAEYYHHYESILLADFIDARMALIDAPQEISVQLNICHEAQITTNPVYLRLVIDNLIKNALIYAKSQVNIFVLIEFNEVVLLVEDDGSGIEPENYETVFIPFARLDSSRSRKTGGIGLGLSITKAATLNMRGSISIEKSNLGGAAFKVRMPLDS